MSEVKWIKLKVNMFEDEKIRLIESMPEGDTLLVIWFKLLSQAGRTNAKGYIFLNENIPYTPEMLSTIYNRPIGTVRLALETFRKFGMIEIDDSDFISVSNWEKHQNIDGMEKIKLDNKERQKRFRERQKQEALGLEVSPENSENGENSNVTDNVIVTESNALDIDKELELDLEKDINKNTPSPKVDYKREFEIFWNAYKKKTDKKNAFTKFKLKRKKFSFEKIMDGVHAYMAQEERRGTETRFIKGPTVFLNGENFNDEYEVVGGARNNAQNDDAEQFIKDNDVPF